MTFQLQMGLDDDLIIFYFSHEKSNVDNAQLTIAQDSIHHHLKLKSNPMRMLNAEWKQPIVINKPAQMHNANVPTCRMSITDGPDPISDCIQMKTQTLRVRENQMGIRLTNAMRIKNEVRWDKNCICNLWNFKSRMLLSRSWSANWTLQSLNIYFPLFLALNSIKIMITPIDKFFVWPISATLII